MWHFSDSKWKKKEAKPRQIDDLNFLPNQNM